MNRRIALSTAAAIAIVVTSGGVAFAANLGILGSSNNEPIGELSAANVAELAPSTTPSSLSPEVVIVDEFITVPGSSTDQPTVSASTRTAGSGAANTVPRSATSGVDGTAGLTGDSPAESPVAAPPVSDPIEQPDAGRGYDDDGYYDDDYEDDDDDDDDYDDDDYDDYDDYDDDDDD